MAPGDGIWPLLISSVFAWPPSTDGAEGWIREGQPWRPHTDTQQQQQRQDPGRPQRRCVRPFLCLDASAALAAMRSSLVVTAASVWALAWGGYAVDAVDDVDDPRRRLELCALQLRGL